MSRPGGSGRRRFDAIVCDLDGVVYRGGAPCPGAAEGLATVRAAGVAVLFLTNNASRPPAEVAAAISAVGVPAAESDVLTSAMVAARSITAGALGPVPGDGQHTPRVLAVGGPGVWDALEEEGLRPTRSAADPGVWAVVQGLGREVDQLDEAAYAIAAGARWLAVNEDSTLPTARGLAIGNGSLVAAVAHATGRRPDLVTGKPQRHASDAALAALGTDRERTLALGDRLDTDIAAARAAGMPSALVLTGVSGRSDVERAAPAHHPDHVLNTLLELPGLVLGDAGPGGSGRAGPSVRDGIVPS